MCLTKELTVLSVVTLTFYGREAYHLTATLYGYLLKTILLLELIHKVYSLWQMLKLYRLMEIFSIRRK